MFEAVAVAALGIGMAPIYCGGGVGMKVYCASTYKQCMMSKAKAATVSMYSLSLYSFILSELCTTARFSSSFSSSEFVFEFLSDDL